MLVWMDGWQATYRKVCKHKRKMHKDPQPTYTHPLRCVIFLSLFLFFSLREQGHVKKDSLGIDLNDLVAAVHMHSDRRGNAEDDSEQLEILFNRIDTSQDGYVSWEEFASYVSIHAPQRSPMQTHPSSSLRKYGRGWVGWVGWVGWFEV